MKAAKPVSPAVSLRVYSTQVSIGSWFSKEKDEVRRSRILVCGLGDKFRELMATDARIYARHYASVSTAAYSTIPELEDALGQRYDVLHLFCDIPPSGTISMGGSTITGTDLIVMCCDAGAKLLWIANDNPSEGYIKNFNARGKRLNLVMTLSRKDDTFTDFLAGLLTRMSQGTTMPNAWVQLAPQNPKGQPNTPECIFFAGRGGVILR
jgi:hypothetical protein